MGEEVFGKAFGNGGGASLGSDGTFGTTVGEMEASPGDPLRAPPDFIPGAGVSTGGRMPTVFGVAGPPAPGAIDGTSLTGEETRPPGVFCVLVGGVKCESVGEMRGFKRDDGASGAGRGLSGAETTRDCGVAGTTDGDAPEGEGETPEDAPLNAGTGSGEGFVRRRSHSMLTWRATLRSASRFADQPRVDWTFTAVGG